MSKPQALIVDDEPDIRELLELTLGRMDVATHAAGDLQTARAIVSEHRLDLCLTDMRLPDGDGIELVEFISRRAPNTPVAVITAHGSMESAVAALKAGAFDFVSKPLDVQVLRALVRTALRLGQDRSPTDQKLIGDSVQMRGVRETISKLARSQAPIFVSGESGTGKELVARLIHELGARSGHPFVPVNCGAIPSELMESELFGHKRGSFTGASSDNPGLFRAAEGGTLFLDEVAELPLSMQVKLLRAIQEKQVRPVGSTGEIPVDVRLISASHRDLDALVAREQFRQDLYYRLNVINLHVPPLRERRSDVPALASHILSRLADEAGCAALELSPEALDRLREYDFPGNVRELENLLERAMTLCEGEQIGPAELALPARRGPAPANDGDAAGTAGESVAGRSEGAGGRDDRPAPRLQEPVSVPAAAGDSQNLTEVLEAVEKQTILDALEKVRWNKTAAAKALGISFGALRYRMQKFGLD